MNLFHLLNLVRIISFNYFLWFLNESIFETRNYLIYILIFLIRWDATAELFRLESVIGVLYVIKLLLLLEQLTIRRSLIWWLSSKRKIYWRLLVVDTIMIDFPFTIHFLQKTHAHLLDFSIHRLFLFLACLSKLEFSITHNRKIFYI